MIEYREDVNFNVVKIKKESFSPSDLKNIPLPSPNEFNYQKGVVIEGKAPCWVYCYLTLLLSNCSWIAIKTQNGAVVVKSDVKEGEILYY